ncbi:MAG TPA: isochorismate synthase [Acidimicrobiales bacterium]|nr:isochorismate synthase [Acidimicrobiales bacterium]
MSASAGGLHARTVPLDYGPDAFQFDGSPTVLFDRPGLTLVGWGTAQLVEARAADDALNAIPCEDAVGGPGSGVVAIGALPFTDAMEGLLVIPRFTMGIASDADGVTRRWATAVGPADEPLPEMAELFDAVIWQYGTAPEAADQGAQVTVSAVTTALDSAGYRAEVAQAVEEMRTAGTRLRKVVLSRPLRVELSGVLPLTPVLRRLRAAEPTCTVFAMPTPDGTFFGASPELLVARHDRRVTCHPLAGTVARGTTARNDADAQGRLAGSDKEHAEHRYVVEAIAEMLTPFCDELDVPKEPSLVAFRSVAHLGTRIAGRLTAPAPTALELLASLHPTPAVGGTPRGEALAAIRKWEPDDRGYWAGPVGWVDARGDGEWMIGIRSALLNAAPTDAPSPTATLSLRAGSGIVADSDPVAEAAETNVKLATVLDTVIPGVSVELR